jgi:hypothetical protein
MPEPLIGPYFGPLVILAGALHPTLWLAAQKDLATKIVEKK